jgi:hypothetical protein
LPTSVAAVPGLQLGAGATTATTLRTVTATDSLDVTRLTTLAGTVSGTRVQVNPVVGQNGVSAGNGAMDAATQRTALATDSPGVGSLTTLAGTVAGGRIAVNPVAGQVGVAGGAGATSALTQRTVTASDSPDVTSLGTLAGTVAGARVAVNPIQGQVGVQAGSGPFTADTQRVVLATDSPGVGSLSALAAVTEETLANVTNGADGTYYYYAAGSGGRLWADQFTLNGGSGTVTVTLEGTVQTACIPAVCVYQDITLSIAGVANTQASAIWAADTPQLYTYVRRKVVAATAGANDADWRIDHKRSW